VGAGLYGILIYCIIAVFIAGLMVGRTQRQPAAVSLSAMNSSKLLLVA
jgi:K+-transporting ATPase A subunit